MWRWFIPNKHNSYKPSVVQWHGTGIVAALLIALQLVYNVTAAGQMQVLAYATDITAGDVISLMNSERSNEGLGSLSYNSKLTNSATAKAQDMFADDYWAHVAPDGKGPDYFIEQAGYAYSRAGENLAKGFQTSSGVVAGWMASPGHKANVLGDYKDVGVAVMNGTLQGEETTLVVAHYGKQYTAQAPEPAPSTVKPKSSSKNTQQNTVAPTQPVTTPQSSVPTTKAETPKKKSTEKSKQKTTAEDKKDEDKPVIITTTGNAATPPSLGIGEQLGIILTSNWAATISLVGLTGLLGLSLLSHHRAWLQHIRKHGFKFHWPTHIHHGAHMALIVAGAGAIIAGIMGTVL